MDWEYEENRIYGIEENGEIIAETNFVHTEDGVVDINHTYVAPALRGHGIASTMMAIVAEYIREKGLKATASCSYANDWLKRNEKMYPDIILKTLNDAPPACRIDGKH